ncbi:hypothetical protein EV360DRAFT_87265 [Lentinula raphanica]|nr:hypothetical protein EV360DRAFT_87265 [Lentinula raphanica]
MFLARMIILLAFMVLQPALSVKILVATPTITSSNASPVVMQVSTPITATWFLEDSDATMSGSGFTMALLNDVSRVGEVTEWSTIIEPSGESTGIVQPMPTATGPHRVEVIPSGRSSNDEGAHSTPTFQIGLRKITRKIISYTNSSDDSSGDSEINSNTQSPSGPPDPSSTRIQTTVTQTNTLSTVISTQNTQYQPSTPSPSSTPSVSHPTQPSSLSTKYLIITLALAATFGTILIMLIMVFLVRRSRRRRLDNSFPLHDPFMILPNQVTDPGQPLSDSEQGSDMELRKEGRRTNTLDFIEHRQKGLGGGIPRTMEHEQPEAGLHHPSAPKVEPRAPQRDSDMATLIGSEG